MYSYHGHHNPLSCSNTAVGFQLDPSIHETHSGLPAKEGIEPGMVVCL